MWSEYEVMSLEVSLKRVSSESQRGYKSCGSHKSCLLTLGSTGLILLCSIWSSSFMRGSIHSCWLRTSCSISSSFSTYEKCSSRSLGGRDGGREVREGGEGGEGGGREGGEEEGEE